MDNNVIAEQIKVYLAQTNRDSDALLKHDTLLLEEWFIDSMAIVALVLFLEKQFGIRMGPADISAVNFRTLDALSTFVAAKTTSH
jgi:acyl carrier protein